MRGVETLYAVYSLHCPEAIRTRPDLGCLKLVDILQVHSVKYIPNEKIRTLGLQELSFFKANKPEDCEEAKKRWAVSCLVRPGISFRMAADAR